MPKILNKDDFKPISSGFCWVHSDGELGVEFKYVKAIGAQGGRGRPTILIKTPVGEYQRQVKNFQEALLAFNIELQRL